MGTCTPTKGYDFIIKSLALIEPEKRPRIVIAANHSIPKWKNYLVDLANELEVEMEILDMVDDEKLLKLYNSATLVLYAPYLEPFGLVPLESMACGTPVLGVKEGGVRETVIHSKTGILVERDESLFADAVKETMENKNKIEEMSDKAVDTVKKFWTLDHAGERIEWHLKHAMNLNK